jgi:hypothetical protein
MAAVPEASFDHPPRQQLHQAQTVDLGPAPTLAWGPVTLRGEAAVLTALPADR